MNTTNRKIHILNDQILLLTAEEIELHNRIISITEPITPENAAVINSSLRVLAMESDSDIILRIQSPGGDVKAGFSILDTINSISCKCNIMTVGTGMVASMAAILLSAGTKGMRYATPNCNILIHQPIANTQGQITDICNYVESFKKDKHKLTKIISDNCGQAFEKVKQDMERDFIMSAEEAFAYGIIDKIGDPILEI